MCISASDRPTLIPFDIDQKTRVCITPVSKERVKTFLSRFDHREEMSPMTGDEWAVCQFIKDNLKSFGPILQFVCVDGIQEACMTAGGEVI